MSNFTELLENESGIQYEGLADALNEDDEYPIIGLMIGKFRRGCIDKPMTITNENIRAMLGYEPKNQYYAAVQDVLKTGVKSVQVLRVVSSTDGEPIEPEEPIDPNPPWEDKPVELEKFDFAIIRYKWTDAGGKDLDTRTYISKPPRNIVLGWDKESSDSTYLQWGKDNTASGVESVLIRIKDLIRDFPNQDEIEVSINAFWYGEPVSGNVSIEFASYKNGSMSASGFDFVNTGGELVQQLTLSSNVTSREKINGQNIGFLRYNPVLMTGQLISA